MSAAPGEPRRLHITGLHHVTVISSDLERTTSFYRDVLGLALLEAGVNDDDPSARHFVFGDPDGAPGTVVSAFEYPQMEQGSVGIGSTHHFALSVETAEELEGWRGWLASRGIPCTEVLDRRHFRSIYLRDPDGNIIEIASRRPGFPPAAGSAPPAGG